MKKSELKQLIKEELNNILKSQNLLESTQQTMILQTLEDELGDLLPHTLIQNNNIMASTALDKSNKPAVRIDSKLKPTAVWLQVKTDDTLGVQVVVKTIVNNKENNLPQYGKKIVQLIADLLTNFKEKDPQTQYSLVVDDDQSGGFWKHMEQMYPQISFIYT